jgi:hypothetical protein
MIVQARRIAPALLVLVVLVTNQLAYAAEALDRPSGHCAAAAPPAGERCRLPLWLPCCDDQAAVGTWLPGPLVGPLLVLPIEVTLPAALPSALRPEARRAEIPPDPPSRLSTVLLI